LGPESASLAAGVVGASEKAEVCGAKSNGHVKSARNKRHPSCRAIQPQVERDCKNSSWRFVCAASVAGMSSTAFDCGPACIFFGMLSLPKEAGRVLSSAPTPPLQMDALWRGKTYLHTHRGSGHSRNDASPPHRPAAAARPAHHTSRLGAFIPAPAPSGARLVAVERRACMHARTLAAHSSNVYKALYQHLTGRTGNKKHVRWG
jgi:hypothetical protein